MALGFLNLKSFHPTNKNNQRRLWIAKEREKDKKAREAEARKELEDEEEFLQQKVMALSGAQSEEQLKNIDSLRQRKGLLAREEAAAAANAETAETDEGEKKKKRNRRRRGKKGDPSTSTENNVNSIEESVLEQVNLERGKRALSFMYAAPPGLKQALEEQEKEAQRQKKIEEVAAKKQKDILQLRQEMGDRFSDNTFFPKPLMVNSLVPPITATEQPKVEEEQHEAIQEQQPVSEPNDSRDHLDRYIPKHMVPDHEKFPMLKRAPVQGTYAANVKIRHKPFGIELRDVRCTRCGGYGHTNMDRECPMRDYNPLDVQRQKMEDPLTFIQQREQAIKSGQSSSGDIIVGPEDDEDEASERILENLNEKERKALMKKLKKLKKEKKKAKKEKKRERREREHERDRESSSSRKRRYDSDSDREHRHRKRRRHDSDDERY